MSVGARFVQLLEEIEEIAGRCGRDPQEISLVSVTKGHSLEEVLPAYEAGAKIFGESRIQEALAKMEKAPEDIAWHLIGTLQKNKVRKVVGAFSLIHSVDNLDLARKISEVSEEMGVVTSILLQANISGEKAKHGLGAGQWEEVFGSLLELPGIAVEGMMTMAPYVDDERAIRYCFRGLRLLRDRLQKIAGSRFVLRHLSMGMSDDYAIAIEEGATLLRVGSAIFSF